MNPGDHGERGVSPNLAALSTTAIYTLVGIYVRMHGRGEVTPAPTIAEYPAKPTGTRKYEGYDVTAPNRQESHRVTGNDDYEMVTDTLAVTLPNMTGGTETVQFETLRVCDHPTNTTILVSQNPHDIDTKVWVMSSQELTEEEALRRFRADETNAWVAFLPDQTDRLVVMWSKDPAVVAAMKESPRDACMKFIEKYASAIAAVRRATS